MLGAVAVLACFGLSACGGGEGDPAGSTPREETPGAREAVERDRPDAAPEEGRAPHTRTYRRNRGRKDRRRGAGRRPSPEVRSKLDDEMRLARELVIELMEGLNERDPSVCTRLFDQRRVRRAQREKLAAGCRRETVERRGRVKLVAIEKTNVVLRPHGARAFVQFVIESGGKRARYVYGLFRTVGEPYRIDAALPVKQPG